MSKESLKSLIKIANKKVSEGGDELVQKGTESGFKGSVEELVALLNQHRELFNDEFDSQLPSLEKHLGTRDEKNLIAMSEVLNGRFKQLMPKEASAEKEEEEDFSALLEQKSVDEMSEEERQAISIESEEASGGEAAVEEPGEEPEEEVVEEDHSFSDLIQETQAEETKKEGDAEGPEETKEASAEEEEDFSALLEQKSVDEMSEEERETINIKDQEQSKADVPPVAEEKDIDTLENTQEGVEIPLAETEVEDPMEENESVVEAVEGLEVPAGDDLGQGEKVNAAEEALGDLESSLGSDTDMDALLSEGDEDEEVGVEQEDAAEEGLGDLESSLESDADMDALLSEDEKAEDASSVEEDATDALLDEEVERGDESSSEKGESLEDLLGESDEEDEGVEDILNENLAVDEMGEENAMDEAEKDADAMLSEIDDLSKDSEVTEMLDTLGEGEEMGEDSEELTFSELVSEATGRDIDPEELEQEPGTTSVSLDELVGDANKSLEGKSGEVISEVYRLESQGENIFESEEEEEVRSKISELVLSGEAKELSLQKVVVRRVTEVEEIPFSVDIKIG